ncbi:segregation/condensation protein A [Longispora sp. K20-0274]|uniref:segregation and condensation protein A n=1 Tax=Longispora sp. K20-0274 TaxID=3088255 RepID=UPI00399C0C6F
MTVTEQATAPDAGFQVKLTNFEGPFDLLLQLIGKHKLDVTEVALHTVTDDFIAYIRAMGDKWDLDEASEFLLIAATLLDLKCARLLPAAEVEDEEDLALLEARDILFARLLQYRAFKQAAAHIAGLIVGGDKRFARSVGLEARYADALPELILGITPDRFARIAARAMTPKIPPTVSISHVHNVKVSVREHAAWIRDHLMRVGIASFRTLCADCDSTLEVVARFLALLELYRENLIGFDQVQALGELTVRWIAGTDVAEIDVEEYEGAVEEPEEARPRKKKFVRRPPTSETGAAGGLPGLDEASAALDAASGSDGSDSDPGSDEDADEDAVQEAIGETA